MDINEKFFKEDPIVKWSALTCPLCQNKTGNSSDCYNMKSDMTALQNKGAMIPVFSESCYWRQYAIWKAHFNYPISEPLFFKFEGIEGIAKLELIDKYSMYVSIADLFDENLVKANINKTFKTFIKEMQSLEHDVSPNINVVENLPVGVIMPNKVKILAENKEEAGILGEIAHNLEGVKPMFQVPEKKKKS